MNPFHYILFLLIAYAIYRTAWKGMAFLAIGSFVTFLGVAIQAYGWSDMKSFWQGGGLSLLSLWMSYQFWLMPGRVANWKENRHYKHIFNNPSPELKGVLDKVKEL